MLKIPMIRKAADVSVYQDDTLWYRFYLVPARPSIKRDEHGAPVFLLATYQIEAADRARDPSLPVGGGYLNLETTFDVPEPQVEEIRGELQEWVAQEHVRRVTAGEATGEAPLVEFADLLLSGGTVRLTAPQSEHLVGGIVGEAPASLTAGSTAVFSMDLTELGSSLMAGLLVDEQGEGQVDLTPFGVIYNLSMWARLPPVKVTVSAQSERVHEILQSVSETNRDNACTPAEVETYRENGTSSSTLVESGVVTVKMDDQNASLPDEVKTAMQAFALELFDTMVKDRFLEPVSMGHAEEIGFDPDDPEISDSAGPVWAAVLYDKPNFNGASLEVTSSLSDLGSLAKRVSSVKVRSGARVTLYDREGMSGTTRSLASTSHQLGGGWSDRAQSVRVWVPPTARYKLRKSTDSSSMDLSITIERSSVVEWPIVAQSTLETFFTGMTPEQVARHVVRVPLDDFQTLGVQVQAFADYSGPVRAVEVECAYVTVDEAGGEDREVAPGMTFTAESTGPVLFDANVVNGNRDYEYRHRVIYDNGTTTDFTAWEVASGRSLNIAVEDPGKLSIDVSAAALNWSIVKAATVTLSHTGDGVDIAHTVELTTNQPTFRWEERFTRQLSGEVQVAVQYLLVDQKVIDGAGFSVPVTQNLVAVPQPQVDVLDVSFVPSGDWADVAQVVVSARYDGGDQRVFDEVFTFTDVTQMHEWQVLLDDSSRRTFQYKVLATYSTAAPAHETDWITLQGDQAVAISAFTPPKLKVQVLPTLVDFARTPAVTVHFEYGGTTETLAFVDATPATFVAAELPGGDHTYTYTVTYHTVAGGEPIVVGPVSTDETALVVRAAQLANEGQLRVVVRGFAVDFSDTPFVDVELRWGDGDREAVEHLTLTVESPNNEWALDIGDRTRRAYRYAITYNRHDGVVVPGPSGEQNAPVLSVPPLDQPPPHQPSPSEPADDST